jgi:hypothetical protein
MTGPIDKLVDQAIANALAGSISGLKVLIGMQDMEPVLETPYCAVFSVLNRFTGRTPIYELMTTIEYVSISGQDTVAEVSSAMTSIDTLISTGADLSGFNFAPGLRYLAWESINRSQQEVGDRRKNIRELLVRATTA